MIVVDASVVVDLLLDTAPHADRIREQIRIHVDDLHVPQLIDAEVGQVLRRHVMTGSLSMHRAKRAVLHLGGIGMTRYPHLWLLDRCLDLRDNLSVYDGLYLALAEALGAPLLTRDRALGTIHSSRAEVIVIA